MIDLLIKNVMPFFPGNFSCIQWYLMSASLPLAASSLRLLACRLRGCCLVLYSWAAVAASTPTSLEASKRLFGCRYVRGLRRVPRQRTSWAKRKNPPKIGFKKLRNWRSSITATVIFWPLQQKLMATLQNEAIIPLITKNTLIYPSDLLILRY